VSPLPVLVAIPLGAAALVFVLPLRWRMFASLITSAILLLVAVALITRVSTEGPVAHDLGGWGAPLGIRLVADGPASLMVLLTTLVVAPCVVYAARSLRGQRAAHGYWPLTWFLVAGANAVWLSADLFNLYVGLELLGLCAVGLVALAGSEEALAAATRYLLATMLGSLAYLLGVGLVYAATGSLVLTDLALHARAEPTVLFGVGFMTLGLLVKAALFPLHGWLPPAHGGALTPVSALLSSLVIKAPLYVLVRLSAQLGADLPVASATVLGALGTAAIFWGGWMALRQSSLKYLVAYSTVSQLGYLFLFFPLSATTSADAAQLAWDGTWLMVVSHALAKAACFLAAGNLVASVGSDAIADFVGVSRHRPWSLASFGLASVSLMGLPPSGGFTAKWLLMESAVTSRQWPWLVALLGGGLLSAAYVFRVFRWVFVDESRRFQPQPFLQEMPAMALAAASIAIGLGARLSIDWAQIGTIARSGT
jgi:multicomponent Na+:H+ antiporter subunit D